MSAESHCCFLEAVDLVFFFIVKKSQKRENDGGLRSGVVMSKTARKFLCSIKNVLSKPLNFSITQLDEQRRFPLSLSRYLPPLYAGCLEKMLSAGHCIVYPSVRLAMLTGKRCTARLFSIAHWA